MDRELFRKRLEEVQSRSDDDWSVDMFQKCLALDPPEVKRQIAMEEAAELSIECSKMNRGMGDRLGLLEEMADMHICLEYLARIHGFGYEEITAAMLVKVERYWEEHGPKADA